MNSLEMGREEDRPLGPALKADDWVVIGGDSIMWMHPPSRRCVTLNGPSPRKTERYDCLAIPTLRGEPADLSTEGYIVRCAIHAESGEPIEGRAFWVEGYGEALAHARKLRAAVLAESVAPVPVHQTELFPVTGTARVPQPWARKVLFVTYCGVLASLDYAGAYNAKLEAEPASSRDDGFEPALVLRLNEIVKRTACEVVASSELCFRMTPAELSARLRKSGLEADVFDVTVSRGRDDCGFPIRAPHAPITNWLGSRTDVLSFAILDPEEGSEDGDAMAALGHRRVRVDADRGLQAEDVERAIALLEMPR